LRLRFSGEPAWSNLGKKIQEARHQMQKTGEP
jgi:hypothetical protein